MILLITISLVYISYITTQYHTHSNVPFVTYNLNNIGLIQRNPPPPPPSQAPPPSQSRGRAIQAPPMYTPTDERSEPPRYSSQHQVAYTSAPYVNATVQSADVDVTTEQTTVA